MGPECPLGDVGSGSGEDGPVHLTVHVSTGSSRSWSPYLSKSSPSLGSKVKRDPSWVIWVIQSMRPVGFTYGAGLIPDQMPTGFPLLVHEPLGSAGAASAFLRSGEPTGQAGISAAVCSWSLGLAVFS